jgi:predicted DsbA family dithiol-disulfide isomerase
MKAVPYDMWVLEKIMLIDIYADVVCPWCYIGKRRLELALAERPDLEVERRWRPFQLQPDLPAKGEPWATFVQTKFGGAARAQAMFDRTAQIAAVDGLHMAFDRVASAPNTRDAHRLILFAADQGREWEMADALFAAYFAEGCDLNDADELAAIAADAGLDVAAVREMLASGTYAAAVDASQQEAAEIGITGVPFYIFDERYAISGAQPVEVFVRALDLASAEVAR